MSNIKKYINQVLLLVILLGALFLRLYHIEKSVWLQTGRDESRDMIVAKHIVTLHENISVGPFAAGGMNWLRNSVVYFYFVAFLWFFTREPVMFMYVWATMMTLPVLGGYFIGKKIKDATTGLIIAAFFAINYQMIASSRELLQPHLLLLFSTGFIWAAAAYLKEKKLEMKYILWMIFFLIFPLHLHYGILILFPFGLLFILWCWLEINNQKEKFSNELFFLPILFFTVVAGSWVLATYRVVPFDQFYFLLFNFEKKYNIDPIYQLFEVILSIRNMVWKNYATNLISSTFFSLMVLSPLLLHLATSLKKRKVQGFEKTTLFLILMSLSPVFFMFYKQGVAETYLIEMMPFFLTLIAVSLRVAIQRQKAIGLLVTILCIGTMGIASGASIFYKPPETSHHTQQKEISKVIFEDYNSFYKETGYQAKTRLLVAMISTERVFPFDGWGTSGIWFYLEEYFGQRLVKNASLGSNFGVIQANPKVIYLVCDHHTKPESIQEECIDRFLNSYPLKKESLQKLSIQEGFSVWKADVDPKFKGPIRNVVYDDILKRK